MTQVYVILIVKGKFKVEIGSRWNHRCCYYLNEIRFFRLQEVTWKTMPGECRTKDGCLLPLDKCEAFIKNKWWEEAKVLIFRKCSFLTMFFSLHTASFTPADSCSLTSYIPAFDWHQRLEWQLLAASMVTGLLCSLLIDSVILGTSEFHKQELTL